MFVLYSFDLTIFDFKLKIMNLNQKIVVAIDGFSSCGKSTFAKLIARELNYVFIDTGAMYRAVSLFALRNNLVSGNAINEKQLVGQLYNIHIALRHDPEGKVCAYLNGENVENDIRGVEVSGWVSEVSKIKEVRKYLVGLQQKMGKEKGIVMDGRDIGTVVFPGAEIKIYMTAGADVRARRRYKELLNKGLTVSFEEVKKNIEDRDYTDLNRKESPLQKANDAIVLDNSYMDLNGQMQWFKELLLDKQLIASSNGSKS
jgi:CMP/dCMP kinase